MPVATPTLMQPDPRTHDDLTRSSAGRRGRGRQLGRHCGPGLPRRIPARSDPQASDLHGSDDKFGKSIRGDNSNFGRAFYDE
jgi:hypothetical protein